MNDFAENGTAPLEVTEEIGEMFTKQFLNVQIVTTNTDNGEEKVEEKISIDISCLLFPRENVEFEWTFDKLKTMSIHYLSIKVESDVPLLSDLLSQKLNPIQINLIAVKDIPYKTDPIYKPIYATLQFVDGQEFTTTEMPQQADCRFKQKHVFLVGKHDPAMLKEMLSTKCVRVFVHNNDEFVNNDDEIYFSMGQAQFSFKDFMRPYCKELKLRSDVFPMKRKAVDNTHILDLNTSARKGEPKTE